MDGLLVSASTSGDDTKSCPRGHWRPTEDEKLRRLVKQYGAQNWNFIAEKLQGRSGMLFRVLVFVLVVIGKMKKKIMLSEFIY